MRGRAAEGSGATAGSHLLLYDGVCGLCDGFVRAILALDRRSVFHFASLQSPVARTVLEPFGSNPDELNTLHVVVNYRSGTSSHVTKARAVLFVMAALGWPWKAAGLLEVVSDAALDAAYDLMGRHRYRVFGKYDHCPLPGPKHRTRFIDQQERLPPP